MKKGFTLMEMLAVILVIAVVVSMTAPVFRTVRYEMKNSQAKAAAKKMAEAMKSYYQASRGHKIDGCFVPSAMTIGSCMTPGATGIPSSSSGIKSSVDQLFACGYLSKKDFAAVPYRFCANDSSSLPSGWPALGSTNTNKIFVLAGGQEGAGEKYKKDKYFIYVDETLTIKERE